MHFDVIHLGGNEANYWLLLAIQQLSVGVESESLGLEDSFEFSRYKVDTD